MNQRAFPPDNPRQTCYNHPMTASQPLTLALDCTQSGLHLALAGGPLPTPTTHSDTSPRAADALHSTLQTILAQHNLTLAEVTRFITTVGPGSFTGIRMGLAVGEALHLLNPQVELIGLGTLEALASNLLTSNHQPPTTNFTLATDAAGQSLYLQPFSPNGTPATEPTCIPASEIPTNFPTYCPASCLLLPTATHLPPFSPTTLLTLAANPATHKPFTPLYVKALTYKASI